MGRERERVRERERERQRERVRVRERGGRQNSIIFSEYLVNRFGLPLRYH